jgi:hypothetical protein
MKVVAHALLVTFPLGIHLRHHLKQVREVSSARPHTPPAAVIVSKAQTIEAGRFDTGNLNGSPDILLRQIRAL